MARSTLSAVIAAQRSSTQWSLAQPPIRAQRRLPFFADQPAWGNQLVKLGVASASIPVQQIDSEKLADAIANAVDNPHLQQKAQEIAHAMAQEAGKEVLIHGKVDHLFDLLDSYYPSSFFRNIEILIYVWFGDPSQYYSINNDNTNVSNGINIGYNSETGVKAIKFVPAMIIYFWFI